MLRIRKHIKHLIKLEKQYAQHQYKLMETLEN